MKMINRIDFADNYIEMATELWESDRLENEENIQALADALEKAGIPLEADVFQEAYETAEDGMEDEAIEAAGDAYQKKYRHAIDDIIEKVEDDAFPFESIEDFETWVQSKYGVLFPEVSEIDDDNIVKQYHDLSKKCDIVIAIEYDDSIEYYNFIGISKNDSLRDQVYSICEAIGECCGIKVEW